MYNIISDDHILRVQIISCRLTFSNRRMDAPRAAALSSTKRRTKRRVPSVSSRTRSSMADVSWSVKIASRVVAGIIMDSNTITAEVVAFKAISVVVFTEAVVVVVVAAAAVQDINSTVLDLCPARPPRMDVKSSWATSHGRPDGASSRITFVSVARWNVPRWPRGAMDAKRVLA